MQPYKSIYLQTTIRHWCKRYKIINSIYNINMNKPTEERKRICL